MAAIRTRGGATMQALLLLQALFLIVEGGTIHHHPQDTERRLPQDHENVLDNDVASDELNHKFFQNMVNTNHELTAVESHQKTSELRPMSIKQSYSSAGAGEKAPQNDVAYVNTEPTTLLSSSFVGGKKNLLEPQEALIMVPRDQKEKVFLLVVPNRPNKRLGKSHHRQKRFITPGKLRVIAVPLSVFNFLGFLPVRVPGLPYHNDLPPPDYTYYNTKHEIPTPKRYRYF